MGKTRTGVIKEKELKTTNHVRSNITLREKRRGKKALSFAHADPRTFPSL